MQPTVDVAVVIPTYQRSRAVVRAIDSALAQTVMPSQIIVVDDGSTDDTLLALEPFEDRIRVVRQAHAGVSAARNHGVQVATSEWVLFLDSDDSLAPEAIDAALGLLESCDMLVFSAVALGRDARPVRILSKPGRSDRFCTAGLLSNDARFAPPWGLIRRRVLIGVGGFDARLSRSVDYDLMLRLVANGHRVSVLRRPVYRYSLPTGRKALGHAPIANASARLRVLAKFERQFPQLASLHRSRIRRLRARYCHALARGWIGCEAAEALVRARAALGQARRLDPWRLRVWRDSLWLSLAPESLRARRRARA